MTEIILREYRKTASVAIDAPFSISYNDLKKAAFSIFKKDPEFYLVHLHRTGPSGAEEESSSPCGVPRILRDFWDQKLYGRENLVVFAHFVPKNSKAIAHSTPVAEESCGELKNDKTEGFAHHALLTLQGQSSAEADSVTSEIAPSISTNNNESASLAVVKLNDTLQSCSITEPELINKDLYTNEPSEMMDISSAPTDEAVNTTVNSKRVTVLVQWIAAAKDFLQDHSEPEYDYSLSTSCITLLEDIQNSILQQIRDPKEEDRRGFRVIAKPQNPEVPGWQWVPAKSHIADLVAKLETRKLRCEVDIAYRPEGDTKYRPLFHPVRKRYDKENRAPRKKSTPIPTDGHTLIFINEHVPSPKKADRRRPSPSVSSAASSPDLNGPMKGGEPNSALPNTPQDLTGHPKALQPSSGHPFPLQLENMIDLIDETNDDTNVFASRSASAPVAQGCNALSLSETTIDNYPNFSALQSMIAPQTPENQFSLIPVRDADSGPRTLREELILRDAVRQSLTQAASRSASPGASGKHPREEITSPSRHDLKRAKREASYSSSISNDSLFVDK